MKLLSRESMEQVSGGLYVKQCMYVMGTNRWGNEWVCGKCFYADKKKDAVTALNKHIIDTNHYTEESIVY